MKFATGLALGLLGGVGIGAAMVQGLHAQATPPVYYVSEIDLSDSEAYASEYLPRAQELIKAGGGQYVASGGPGSSGKVIGFDGEAPKSRVVIIKWDSLDKIQAWRSSPDFQENRKIGDKYAKFRSFAVDGVPQ
jgi:uncharacterized protein (DUF1330 family)